MATFDSVRRVMKDIRVTLNSPAFTKELGTQGKDLLFKRVKSGKGLSDVVRLIPNSASLKKLSGKYINQRKRTGVPGKFGTPRKSNLTYTGQMLDSLILEFNSRGFTIIIPNTSRKEFPVPKSRRKKRRSALPTNAEVAQYVEDGGRPFFKFTKSEINILRKAIRDKIRKITRRVT